MSRRNVQLSLRRQDGSEKQSGRRSALSKLRTPLVQSRHGARCAPRSILRLRPEISNALSTVVFVQMTSRQSVPWWGSPARDLTALCQEYSPGRKSLEIRAMLLCLQPASNPPPPCPCPRDSAWQPPKSDLTRLRRPSPVRDRRIVPELAPKPQESGPQ
jgi:hypothetical protein